VTVRELIDQLKDFDGETEVQIDFVEEADRSLALTIETVDLDPIIGTVIIEAVEL